MAGFPDDSIDWLDITSVVHAAAEGQHILLPLDTEHQLVTAKCTHAHVCAMMSSHVEMCA